MTRAWSVSGRVAVAAVAIWLAGSSVFFALGPYEALRTAAGGSLPEERFGYGEADVQRAFAALGEATRSRYVTFQCLDALNAAMTSAAAAAVLLWSLTRRAWAGRVARCVAWLPLALLAGEGIENMLLALLAWSYPTEMPWMVQAASAVTRVKLVVGVFVLIAIVASILAGALRRDPHGAERAG